MLIDPQTLGALTFLCRKLPGVEVPSDKCQTSGPHWIVSVDYNPYIAHISEDIPWIYNSVFVGPLTMRGAAPSDR